MRAVEILVHEHDHILALLAHLDRAAGSIVRNEGPPRELLEEALSIAREFADRFHHYKEEHVMFALLAQKRNGALDGEIERHRIQHEQCRDLIQRISDALPAYSRELDASARVVHRNLDDYVRTLRSHIRSENEVFFPMAEEALSVAEGEALLVEFERYEAKCDADLDAYRARIEALAT